MKHLSFISLFVASFSLSILSCFGQDNKEYLRKKIIEAEGISYYNYEVAAKMLEELYNMAEWHPDDNAYYTACLYLESVLNEHHARHDTLMIRKLDEYISRLEQQPEKNISDLAFAKYALAMNYLIEYQYIEGFFAALQSLNHFKELNDTLHIAKSLNVLGKISSQIYSFNRAYDYYSEALSYLEKDNLLYYHTKANLFLANSFINNHPQELIDSLSSLVEPIERLGHPTHLFNLYSNIGVIYSLLGDYGTSLKHYNYIRDHIHLSDNNRFYYGLYFNMADYHRNNDNLDSALYYFKEAHRITGEMNNNRLMSNCLQQISSINEQLGHIDSAYNYIAKYVEVSNALNDNVRIFESSQRYIYSTLDYMEKEVEMREQKLMLRNTIIVIVFILAIAAVGVVVLLLIVIRQKKNKQILLKETLDAREREVTTSSLLLSNKNNVLSHIQEIVKEITPSEKDKNKIISINSLIKNNINAEQDWETFVMHFEQVHPNFFTNLKKYSSELTPTNLRFCAYFRLRLSTKEIATILNITPTTVKVTRFRLKKKFGLSESDNLDEFIARV